MIQDETAVTVPDSDIDLFTDEALTDPYPLFTALRGVGPVVRLPKYAFAVLTRYEDVRRALEDWETFSSASGVGLNPAINSAMSGTIINSDPPHHTSLRTVLSARLAPRALAQMKSSIVEKAERFVDELVDRRAFDAVTDLARTFPMAVVLDLLGFPEDGRDQLLRWGSATFDAMGPDNARSADALPVAAEMFAWLATSCTPDRMRSGGFATTIHEAAARGDIPQEAVIPLMAGYSIPAFDTTISTIASAISLFARFPEQWALVRADPGLIPAAINEVLRLEPPIPLFARVLTRPYRGLLGAGERVLLLFGSANRDERKFVDADRFDVRRNPVDHLTFGYGIHGCPGQGLARMEIQALLAALARRVSRFEVTAPPRRELNNMTRALASLPVAVV
ncbi:cytochrome P450 [Pseudonocardia dioxanivorans]|uniref:cytochrome P450 n=1 Tax=Pseudonocardia dioxanivorans TaxID=240495 RepID=UPI0018F8AA96|nr:cytochrome P450 [Pseudonocardia dioxanivorans]